MWLSDAWASRAHASGSLYLECYVELASRALVAGDCMWKLRPKMHDFQEQLERLMLDKYNLLYHQCLFDEHMLGIFKATAK
eukprot:175825-Heterocapsa_arctica.AAC.1